MNPDTNKFEPLTVDEIVMEHERKMGKALQLLRPDGTPVPQHWSVFAVGEKVVIKDYTFEVKYIGETAILFEPVGPIEIGKGG